MLKILSVRVRDACNVMLGELVTLSLRRMPWLRHLPNTKRGRGFGAPWRAPSLDTPESLRTVPGIWRDEEAAERAHLEAPLYSFNAIHLKEVYRANRFLWPMILGEVPRFLRIDAALNEVIDEQPSTPPPAADPQALTEELRAEARRIGLSAIGFAPYDPKYVFAEVMSPRSEETMLTAERGGPPDQGTVIVCLLEQGWDATQTIPSLRAEREAIRTYEGVVERSAPLAKFLHAKGFRAQVGGPTGPGVSIHYAVQAGLGQLGLNGQLLTPQSGSRCRITLICTNAELVHDQPVDYGIHAICDECKLCVRRCPPGAIPQRREYHRGVLKAKIKPERCFPVVAQTHGCAICMKVCPVQRYGLDAVKEHYVQAGEILGKGTDELEGYHWPLDGKHYGPGEKPRISSELLTAGGFDIDPKRTVPMGVEQHVAQRPRESELSDDSSPDQRMGTATRRVFDARMVVTPQQSEGERSPGT